MGARTSSLDAPVGEDGESTLADCLAAENACTDRYAELNDRSKVFGKVMKDNLSTQEMDVLRLYFGFDMDADLNLKEIAPMVGLSKERVRQLKETALAKLRNDQIERLLHEAA